MMTEINNKINLLLLCVQQQQKKKMVMPWKALRDIVFNTVLDRERKRTSNRTGEEIEGCSNTLVVVLVGKKRRAVK